MNENLDPDEDFDLDALIAVIARSWHRRFHLVDRDDISQELWCWTLAQDVLPVEERKLSRRLNDVANRYCRNERAARLGYRPEDEFCYSLAMLEEMLPEALTGDVGGGQRLTDAPPSRGDPAEGNNRPAMMLDIHRAFRGLSSPVQRLLTARCLEEQTFTELADAYGCSVATMHRRVTSALRKMQTALGGPSPMQGRRAITNAHAAAITSNQEAG